MRITRDEMFMRIAYVVAERGTCPRAKVGAIVVNPHFKIVSIGYNGNKSGEPHCEDVGCKMHRGHCSTSIHAEANAIGGLMGRGPYTLYVTHLPCAKCKDLILKEERIHKVIYDIPYRYDGPDNFTEGGVVFERYQGRKL